MSAFRSLEEFYLRALDVNLRYYASFGRLAADYLRDLSSAVATGRTQPVQTGAPASPRANPAASAGSSAQPQAAAPAVMVFEGETGSTAMGVFLVGNSLTHEVTAPITASPVRDGSGNAVNLAFSFEPAVVNLAPGEQMLVRATVVIDQALEPGVRHRGELLIPELAGSRIPFIVRRRNAGNPL